MTPDQRLASIVAALQSTGLNVLVMGGHAVRYYGVTRNTADFDLVVSVTSPMELGAKVLSTPLLREALEVAVWRSDDFARFEIGKLPDGRPELLEFWIRNHLLADFPTLLSRSESGAYGGAELRFLSLDDLLKSKETERQGDWDDILLLEEIRDSRLLARATDSAGVIRALSRVCSLRGFEALRQKGLLSDESNFRFAAEQCTHPVTLAYLYPKSHGALTRFPLAPSDASAWEAIGRAEFGSTLHLGLVEVIRRAYKRRAMEIDRLDKQSKLRALK